MMNALLLAATMVSPITWQEIDFDQKLLLNDSLTFSPKVTLQQGTTLTVSDVIPLDSIRVLSYKMKVTPCKSDLKNEISDMVIIDELYGAQLEKGCTVNVFTELSDLSKPSLFSLISR